MHLQKLVEVLKKLDEEQIKRLDEYVRSPYFRIPPVCVLLLNRLMPLHPRFMETKMQWQKLGKKDVTLSTIAKQRNAATGLLKAIDGFIAQEQWELNKLESTRLKLKGYKQLQLEDKFEDGYKEQMAFLEDEPEQDIDTFYEKHMLVELSMQGVAARANRTANNDIRPVIKTLDEYYAMKKMRYLCEALSRQLVLGVEYTPDNTAFIVSKLEPYTKANYPYVYLFVNVFGMVSSKEFEKSLDYYYTLKRFIQDVSTEIISQSIKEVVDYILNNFMRWSNKGYKEAGAEYLWWIKWKMSKSLLLQEGRLLPVTFRNIVGVAKMQEDVAIMEDVIKHYSVYLPDNHYVANLMYANGLYYYIKSNFKEAARAFLQADPREDLMFSCLVRYWHWRSLYEFDDEDFESLNTHLLSFEKYVYRNAKVLKHRAKTFQLFIKYSYSLIKCGSKLEYEKCLLELTAEQKFAGKDWLVGNYTIKLQKRPVHI